MAPALVTHPSPSSSSTGGKSLRAAPRWEHRTPAGGREPGLQKYRRALGAEELSREKGLGREGTTLPAQGSGNIPGMQGTLPDKGCAQASLTEMKSSERWEPREEFSSWFNSALGVGGDAGKGWVALFPAVAFPSLTPYFITTNKLSFASPLSCFPGYS